MANRNTKTEEIKGGAISNTLYILIENQRKGRVKDNYASQISEEYDLSQGGVSNNLKEMKRIGLIEGMKDGRKKVYKVKWSKLSEMFYTYSKGIYYFDMPEEDLYDTESPEFEDYDVGEEYDEFLQELEKIVETQKFEELVEKVMEQFVKRMDLEKSESGRFNKPLLSNVCKIMITVLSERGELFDNELKGISQVSNISEEEALSTLRVEEDKKELLNLLRGIKNQYIHVAGDYVDEDLELLDKVTVEVFDDYFDFYSKNPLMIEKDFLDRVP